ncbi:uncharacterized protein MELLADRAFT_108235 [Melampsora larici-populina 98AG31]|uniref:Uncharacterized protein n=1 Tax=Melampsora larici-populina (strain 98AG31 / pathotype 3-4-7) TaxID=747676 RepID=F4RSE6_MELLP|nr:uncharacterized protein MELLADRAFT_108235 [Melampsora larici-populina 98AG31]EGG04705.1 hypothetical protein MELLADRAFT_108235 [Melampsora larici-populina 98AG31]
MLKSMKAIESLLEALSQLNNLQQALNKCQKKIMKGCKDLAHVLSEDTLSKEEIADNVLINTLLCASNFFGSFHEVTKTTAKNTEKEYNTLQDVVTKAFKKIVKEERTHDEHLDALESKIQKANYTFDKHRKPAKKGIGMSGGHSDSQDGTVAADRYYASISSLGLDVTKSKAAHSSVLHYRRESLCRIFCKSLFHFAETEWKRSCEEVKSCGMLIGRFTMWANFCNSDGMPKKIPVGHQEEDSMSVRSLSLHPDSSRLQGDNIEKMKENIDYPRSTSAFKQSSPAAMFPPESLSSSTYTTQGLGLVRSSSKTLRPRPHPGSISSGPHLSASLGPSRPPMEHANMNFYTPQLQHQVEQTSREALIQKEPSHTQAKSEASLATVSSNATAPLAVRKNSRNSQSGMSPRPEDYDLNVGNAFSSANQDQISSQLLRILNPEDLSKFDFLSRMTPEQLSNILANNRAIESHRATLELSRLIDRKPMGSHFAESVDHVESPTHSEFLEIPHYEGIPECGEQVSRTSSSAMPTRQFSTQDKAGINYPSAAVVGDQITQNDEPNSRESDASSFLDRQSSIASVGSTRSKVSEMKYLYSKQKPKDLDPISTTQIPTQVATAIVEQSSSHGSSVAALASRFSALADPYMRQFETQQPTNPTSTSRQGPTSTIPQRSKNTNPRLHEGATQPMMRPNHNLPTGHLPLLPNRSLAQSNLHQFRMMGQPTKSQDKDTES